MNKLVKKALTDKAARSKKSLKKVAVAQSDHYAAWQG